MSLPMVKCCSGRAGMKQQLCNNVLHDNYPVGNGIVLLLVLLGQGDKKP